MHINVLFVCLGNICRSPTAHGLFEHTVKQAGLAEHIHVDSAGTGGWHIGNPPDSRAQATALARGYDISQLKARQVDSVDYNKFDYILGMDRQNILDLNALKPSSYQGISGLFLEIAGVGDGLEVPDPYYGGDAHFKEVIHLVEQGCEGLLTRIQREHNI